MLRMALSKLVMALFAFYFVFKYGLANPTNVERSKHDNSKLIVISMDGLMFKQIRGKVMPFTKQFYKNGVHCPKLQPVFPTKTLVNHFSIATGNLDKWKQIN